MNFKCLLAKSSATPNEPAGPERLHGHTALVVAASLRMLEHCATASLSAAGLEPSWKDRLVRIVRTAAFVHDLGKCSDHFQAMVRRQRRDQLLRHEALSGWLAWPGTRIGDWLASSELGEYDLRLACAAALGHHRKFRPEAYRDGSGELVLLVSHSDFAATLRYGGRKLELGDPPFFASDDVIRDPDAVLQQFNTWHDEFDELDELERRLLAVAKALVIASDVAGSALPRAQRSPRWVHEQLRRHDSAAAGKIAEARLKGAAARPFQLDVSRASAPVTLVRAGCGTGKTLAAYLWAAEQHPDRRLWFTYPTTGTTTEGYRDYLDDKDVAALLDHSRARVDYDIFGLKDGSGLGRDADRLQALRSWAVDVTTSTVDTVLGLLQNQRKGLYAWPSLCRSAVVFDEIHAYDELLFGALLEFIRQLPGIPKLLMTASLPTPRLDALREEVRRAHETDLPVINGPADLERLPRYRIRRTQEPDAFAEVVTAVGRGGKVLWVCNTVGRALALAQRAQSLGPVVYHSRFRYRDRVRRHGEVVDGFARGGILAVTTQVAEMSLDLSADLLVTDLAPIPALIQRLGRLNRRSTPAQRRPVCECLVLPFAGKPYEQDDLNEASTWLSALGAADLSQQDLVDRWRPRPQAVPRSGSSWLSPIDTKPGQLRTSSPGLSVLLAEDARAVRNRIVDIVEVILPMNEPPTASLRSAARRQWPREHGIPIVPEGLIDYGESVGGRWQP